MNLINALASIPGIGPLLPYLVVAMVISSGLATVWRPHWPGYALINFLATNFGQATNATDPKVKP